MLKYYIFLGRREAPGEKKSQNIPNSESESLNVGRQNTEPILVLPKELEPRRIFKKMAGLGKSWAGRRRRGARRGRGRRGRCRRLAACVLRPGPSLLTTPLPPGRCHLNPSVGWFWGATSVGHRRLRTSHNLPLPPLPGG